MSLLFRSFFTSIPIAMLVLSASSLAAETIDSSLLHGLKARLVGPATVSGRITAIDAVHQDPNHILIGTATGGAWISENGGLSWSPVFDDQPVASIGAVAIFQDNPDIMWLGTGEGNVRNSTSIGDGMFKSIDGGKTWQRAGLQGTERINRIALHPHNPDIVYAAALGTLWGDSDQRGIYKTADGGKSWTRILLDNDRSGGTDVKLDPFNPDKVYASLWEHRRWPYQFKSGGPGSGVYISWDGGANWQRKTSKDGLPEGPLGRVTFSPSPAQKGRVYALVEAEKSAMVRSDDGGRSWIRVNEDYDIAIRPFYYTEVAADPENPDRVYNVFTRLSVSIDGGRQFTLNPVVNCCAASNTIHIDVHDLWINPADSRHLILGNDGGIAISRDRGETWRYVRNLPLSQFYHIRVDNDEPYNIYGGMQDNGSWRGPAEVWENGGIRNFHWQEVGFGDGFDTAPDPQNSRRGYGMAQGGFLYTWDLDSGEQRVIRPPPHHEGAELRFNWNAALAQDPFDDATIYYGSQFVHRSNDRGKSWSVISDDLTSNNSEWQTYRESGGLTPDVTAAENFTTIVTIAPSPLEKGTLWVGTDDGRVHVTRDGGSNWKRIDRGARGVPEGTWVPMIAPSPHDASTAFVVFDNHRRSDMKPYVYRVSDYGNDWDALADDSISGYALAILQDPVDEDLIFLGTEFGLWFSNNQGESWTRFSAGLPTVSVMDMAIQDREVDLVLGTHGRSVYVIDDYRALRGLRQQALTNRLSILSASPGVPYAPNQTPSTRFPGSGEFRADNEPYGVMVTFVANGEDLPEPNVEDKYDDDDSKVELTVSDSQGEVIRTLRLPVHQGINRLTWNMQRDGVRPLPGPDASKIEDGLPGGPQVPAGTYQLSLSLEDSESNVTTASTAVEVTDDPRNSHAVDRYAANYQAQLDLLALQEQAVAAVERIYHARENVNTTLTLIKQQQDSKKDEGLEDLRDQAQEILESLDKLENNYRVLPETKGNVYDDDRVVNQIGNAFGYVSSTRDEPSDAALVYVQQARQSLESADSSLGAFFANELKDFSEAVDRNGLSLFGNLVP